MEPILQWLLGIYATLTVAAILGMAKFLRGIEIKIGTLDTKVALFVQSAEQRFESQEGKIEDLSDRVHDLDGR